jgi:hypothetical protein
MGLLKRLFSRKPGWNGTPEMYLAMIMEMQAMNNNAFSEQEILQLEAIMQKVININLSPYQDFTDLLARGTPDFSQVKLMREQMKANQSRVELKKAIYGKHADLGDDDVMKSDADDAIFARKLIDDLSKYIEFKNDDKDEH